MPSTGRRSPISERCRRTQTPRDGNEGNGVRRSPSFLGLACGVLGLIAATDASAQLEILLRGVQPTEPKPGACGSYRFRAEEPDGNRQIDFQVCVESVSRDKDGAVVLRLWSGDSLEARIEVGRAMFAGAGGALLDHVRKVVQIEGGKTQELRAEDWQKLPALRATPRLPVVADSTWGPELHAETGLECAGRFLVEAKESRTRMGEADVVISERRQMRVLTAVPAPIFGVVRASAVLRSERRFSQPIAGVPQRGPRESRYELELTSLGGSRPR